MYTRIVFGEKFFNRRSSIYQPSTTESCRRLPERTYRVTETWLTKPQSADR